MPTFTTGGYGHPPNYTPTHPDPPTEITAGQKLAAQHEHAQWISRDGSAIFIERMGHLCWGYWIDLDRRYSAWLECPSLPEGAIKLDEQSK